MKIFLLDLSQIEVSYRKCCNVGGVDFLLGLGTIGCILLGTGYTNECLHRVSEPSRLIQYVWL